MRIIEDVLEMKAFSNEARRGGEVIVFVPTMGFLHDGHRKLLSTARKLGTVLVLSIFVNPAQFGPKEDFGSYPRDIERDLKMAREEGVDAVFTPTAAQMYPQGYQTTVNVEKLAQNLCGASRPGHFAGVATVVLKLFNTVVPHKALFGRKDYQQLLVIKRMVADLDLDIEIIGVDTVREADGLAMSSRNSYLSAQERKAAAAIPGALEAAKEAFRGGVRDSGRILAEVKKIIENEPLCAVEYVKVTDPETLADIKGEIKGGALVAVAVRLGKARLIDNIVLP